MSLYNGGEDREAFTKAGTEVATVSLPGCRLLFTLTRLRSDNMKSAASDIWSVTLYKVTFRGVSTTASPLFLRQWRLQSGSDEISTEVPIIRGDQ